MRIALIGSGIEPVIGHSTMHRQPDEQADARAGGCEAIAACWSTKSAAGAADERGRARRAQVVARRPRAVAPTGSPSASDVDLPGVSRPARAARDRAHARERVDAA